MIIYMGKQRASHKNKKKQTDNRSCSLNQGPQAGLTKKTSNRSCNSNQGPQAGLTARLRLSIDIKDADSVSKQLT